MSLIIRIKIDLNIGGIMRKRIVNNRVLDYSKFNTDMTGFVNDNKIQSPTNYLMVTSLRDKLTYIYRKENNQWSLIHKWSCTVGKPSTPTIKGVFNVGSKYESITSEGSTVFVKYATNITGEYYYHSILYRLSDGEVYDDKLGVAISHGCIRLATENAAWIYYNVPTGTTIIIN